MAPIRQDKRSKVYQIQLKKINVLSAVALFMFLFPHFCINVFILAFLVFGIFTIVCILYAIYK